MQAWSRCAGHEEWGRLQEGRKVGMGQRSSKDRCWRWTFQVGRAESMQIPGGSLEEQAGFQGLGSPAGDPVPILGVWELQVSRID